MLTFSSRFASLLFKWKAADTVLVSLSFNLHFWRYADKVDMSWLRVPSSVSDFLAGYTIARSSAYAYFAETVFGRSWV